MKSFLSSFLIFVAFYGCAAFPSSASAQPVNQAEKPLRLAITGLVHGHAGGFLNSIKGRTDVEIVGVVEPDTQLAARYSGTFGLDNSILFNDLAQMLEETRPEVVATFTSTFDHPMVVEECARRGIHVMMEKPLAVNIEHALRIQDAAEKHGIHVFVNYETTWYPSNHELYNRVIEQNSIGAIKKMVVHDGHRGPKEIGVGPEFLKWLTDPVLNGGGALTDFGCYGANLMTWLMNNQKPISVTSITQQLKDDPVYQNVDDEATIVLTYPDAQGIIQASWNWPFNRKDIEVYGENGYVFALDPRTIQVRLDDPEEITLTSTRSDFIGDPVTYLISVLRGRIRPDSLSSLENNLIVTEILDAARLSAERGETIVLE